MKSIKLLTMLFACVAIVGLFSCETEISKENQSFDKIQNLKIEDEPGYAAKISE